MRYRLYLETSFWRRLADSHDPERRRISYAFLREAAARDRILISALVRDELRDTPDPHEKRKIFRRLAGVRTRTVTANPTVARFSENLRSLGGWGTRRIADMFHVGYAVFARADALVTWDREDLARERMREVVRAFARRRGVAAPLIGTPEEVASWLGISAIP